MEPIQLVQGLFLGNKSTGSDAELVRKFGIEAICNVGAGKPKLTNVATLKVSLPDRPDADLKSILDEAVDFIHSHIEKGESVLVHCQGAVSRSPSVAIAYMLKYCNMTFEESLHLIQQKRPACRIRPEFKLALQIWRGLGDELQ